MGIVRDDQPICTVVPVSAKISVNVGLRKCIPSIVVIVVAAARSVNVVAGCIAPKSIVVVVSASRTVDMGVASVGEPNAVFKKVSASEPVYMPDRKA